MIIIIDDLNQLDVISSLNLNMNRYLKLFFLMFGNLIYLFCPAFLMYNSPVT